MIAIRCWLGKTQDQPGTLRTVFAREAARLPETIDAQPIEHPERLFMARPSPRLFPNKGRRGAWTPEFLVVGVGLEWSGEVRYRAGT